jgi:hypothetical protein
MITQYMANILTQKALNALAKFLASLNIALPKRKLRLVFFGISGKGFDALVLLKIPSKIGDQILNDGKGLEWLNGYFFPFLKLIHAGHTRQARHAINFHAAGTALSRLAIPAHRQIPRLPRLNAVNGVENHHARTQIDSKMFELTSVLVPAPNPESSLAHFPFSNSFSVALAI